MRKTAKIKQKRASNMLWIWLFGGFGLGLMFLCALFLAVFISFTIPLSVYLVWASEASATSSIIQAPPNPAIVSVSATSTPVPAQIPQSEPKPQIKQAVPPTPATILAVPTPHLLEPYTIEGLRARTYPGGTINIRRILTTTDTFSRYYIDYPSDHLNITGVMQIPSGEGPFPVIILNHGYIPQDTYWPGADTWNAAAILNEAGYLTIAPDFRSWGDSDIDNSFFSTGQLIDSLNLISSLSSIKAADTTRVGFWGHSMGAGITLKALTIDSRIKGAVLYAPVSGHEGDNIARWGPGCTAAQPYKLANKCGGADIINPDIEAELYLTYGQAIYDPGILDQVSAINYLESISAPVQIHIGTADSITPPEWSVEINDALKKEEKTVDLFIYQDQGHAFKGQSWQLFMERVVDFFDRTL